jgi:alcohol dehydrogenase (cytochrome c)
MNGYLLILDAKTGERLHRVSAGAPIGGGVITYDVGGRQYIAVAAGSISPIWPLDPATARVRVFGIR